VGALVIATPAGAAARAIMKRLLALLGSTRLAIVTLSYLAVACMLATLVPQNRFFASPAFILPAFLFAENF
jgi:hypothetical protein